MDEQAFVGLVRDLEMAKGRIDGHERECAARYAGIQQWQQMHSERTDAMAVQVTAIAEKLGAHHENAHLLNRKVLVALIAAMFGALCWAGGQLYHLKADAPPAAAASR